MASNRAFWKVMAWFAAGGVALVVLVIAFRPLARTGAVAYAQSNLRAAADAAARIERAEGSLADATPLRLRLEPGLDDLLFIDPDQSSNDAEIVSVDARSGSWVAAARADTGVCFWLRVVASGGIEYGTGTDCSAEQAGVAAAGTWPEP